jgi:TolA-binding protein
VRATVLGLVVVCVVLAGCGGWLRQRPLTVDATRSPAGEAARPSAPPTAESPKLVAELTRVAGELSELQNVVAKLMASSLQVENQLAYLQRRVGELESESRSRAPSPPSGFAPPAPPRAPAGPATGSATTTPAEDLYRVGVERLQAKELDAALLILYDLVTTYPDHPLRESAQLLVADVLYRQKDYRGALAELEALVGAIPRSTKVPDALLLIGLCQRGLGDETLAKRTWGSLVRDYPESAAARRAQVLLRG